MDNLKHNVPMTSMTRRQFLGTLGVAGTVATGLRWPDVTHAAPARQANPEDQFGRMFDLPPFAAQSPSVEAALMELGRPGGILDAKDPLTAGPIELITNPALSAGNPNNPSHTAGTTFMGQFMDHDTTFDTDSRLGAPSPPQHSTNARTPAFDLDSVYGGGPTVSPQLYDPASPGKFKVESGGVFEDLPRDASRRAIIGDPRNDENVMLSGLHAAFLLFHNHAMDFVKSSPGSLGANEVFNRARQLTTWHYQWMILHEFLPLFVGQSMVNTILSQGRKYYTPRRGAFMPVEFQGAAYRFGHSMVRPSYRANLKGDNGGPFFGMIFDFSELGGADPASLIGGARAPRRFVGWQTFFDFGDGEMKPNKLIDTKLSTVLFSLPPGTIAGDATLRVLPQRTLLRSLTWNLPSGQSIARHIGASPLTKAELSELRPLRLDESTPLFYYVLKEAELVNRGRYLGPVGGTIVGEVIMGLLQLDPNSYLSVNKNWTPTLPVSGGGTNFRMTDFLRFAGVDPATRGQ